MDSLVSTILTSALVATVTGAAINAWLESRKAKHATRFDALKAAVALEGYALCCSERISSHDLALSSGGHAGSFIGNLPEIPTLNVVAGFLRPRKASVANQLLTFPQEAEQAEQYIDFWWQVAGIDEVREAAAGQVAKLGLKALEIASEIRLAFNLPERELVFGRFNPKHSMEKALEEYLGD